MHPHGCLLIWQASFPGLHRSLWHPMCQDSRPDGSLQSEDRGARQKLLPQARTECPVNSIISTSRRAPPQGAHRPVEKNTCYTSYSLHSTRHAVHKSLSTCRMQYINFLLFSYDHLSDYITPGKFLATHFFQSKARNRVRISLLW